jgi:hypothetical protein
VILLSLPPEQLGFQALATGTQLDLLFLKTSHRGQVLVTHACNPSSSGGREQEDQGSKPGRSYLEKTHHIKGLVEWIKV